MLKVEIGMSKRKPWTLIVLVCKDLQKETEKTSLCKEFPNLPIQDSSSKFLERVLQMISRSTIKTLMWKGLTGVNL